MRYIALIDGRPGAYGVVVPDLPGCTSAGRSLEEAYRNAIEAVRLWIEDAEADGEKPRPPRTLDILHRDPEIADTLAAGAVATIVPVLRDTGRPAKANVSLDAGLLEAIDEAAAMHRLTRSAFIATAAREKIGHAKEGPPPGRAAGRQAALAPRPSAVASKSLRRPRSTVAVPSRKGKRGGTGRGHRREAK